MLTLHEGVAVEHQLVFQRNTRDFAKTAGKSLKLSAQVAHGAQSSRRLNDVLEIELALGKRFLKDWMVPQD